MLLVVSFFKLTGLFTVNFSTNVPILGVSANYFWLHSNTITLGEALNSPFAVMGVLGTVIFAPLLEEAVFRGLVCKPVSDETRKLKPQFLFVILVVSFIAF